MDRGIFQRKPHEGHVTWPGEGDAGLLEEVTLQFCLQMDKVHEDFL